MTILKGAPHKSVTICRGWLQKHLDSQGFQHPPRLGIIGMAHKYTAQEALGKVGAPVAQVGLSQL